LSNLAHHHRNVDRKAQVKGWNGRKCLTSGASEVSVNHEVSVMSEATDDLPAPSRLESAISELQGLHELLLSGDLDPRVLADFRDALNRVRTAAWAAQQYVARKETNEDSSSVLAFLVGERIRATYNLCQGLSDDLKRTDIKFQTGSLVQLHEVTKALTEQLNDIINRLD
jgi:hypothetical protein